MHQQRNNCKRLAKKARKVWKSDQKPFIQLRMPVVTSEVREDTADTSYVLLSSQRLVSPLIPINEFVRIITVIICSTSSASSTTRSKLIVACVHTRISNPLILYYRLCTSQTQHNDSWATFLLR